MADMIARTSSALGRRGAPTSVTAPPEVEAARLVSRDEDLTTRFVTNAQLAKMRVVECDRGSIADAVAGELKAKSVVLTRSGIVASIDLSSKLRERGFDARWWSDISRDQCFDIDTGISDCICAVAETGSLVVRASPEHGRSVSLVPRLHIAIVEQSQIVPDLLDAMQLLSRDGTGSGAVFITGPSKTSDIEMTLVTGVHGPMEVVVFLV